MYVVLERPAALAKLASVVVLNRTVIAPAGAEKGHVVIKYGRIRAINPEWELLLCLIRQFRYSRPKSFTYNDLQRLACIEREQNE
jgi:hypothetical protein